MLYLAGIILSFFLGLLLLSKKNKTLGDKILSGWLLLIGIHLLFYFLFRTGKIYSYPWLLGIEIPLPLLHGPMLFLYTASMTNRLPKRRVLVLLHFIPAALSYFYIIPFFLLPSDQKIFIFQNNGVGYELFNAINFAAIVISGYAYIIWTSILLRKHRRAILQQFSYTEQINLVWLQYLIYGMAFIWFFVFAGDEFIYGAAVIFVLFIGYFGIRQVGIFTSGNEASSLPQDSMNNSAENLKPIDDETEKRNATTTSSEVNSEKPEETIEEVKRKYAKSGLTDETAEQLHQKLTQLIYGEKLFHESELTLTELAKRLNTHPNYLSQIINEKEGKNFYDYINTLRIEEFKKKISDPANQQFTLLALAFDSGFNSKSSFNRYFKKVTGQSPSEYLQLHRG